MLDETHTRRGLTYAPLQADMTGQHDSLSVLSGSVMVSVSTQATKRKEKMLKRRRKRKQLSW
jgi:hypothetical protein